MEKEKEKEEQPIQLEQWVSPIQLKFTRENHVESRKMKYFVEKLQFKDDIIDPSKEVAINHFDNYKEMTKLEYFLPNLK